MYEVFVKGIDYCLKVFEGLSKEEAYEEYYGSLSEASLSDEVILTLDNQIIDTDCEHDQFELFDSEIDFDESEEDPLDLFV